MSEMPARIKGPEPACRHIRERYAVEVVASYVVNEGSEEKGWARDMHVFADVLTCETTDCGSPSIVDDKVDLW